MNTPKNLFSHRAASVIFLLFAASLFIISWMPNEKEIAGDDNPVWLEQNWSTQEREDWYLTSQGSQIFPYEWFAVLEKAGSTEPFIKNMEERFGFLPGPVSETGNPYNLPLGFAMDEGNDNLNDKFMMKKWVGFTCAACHTGGISYKPSQDSEAKFFIIDGAPSHFDFENFKQDLFNAINETYTDNAKLDRFVKNANVKAEVKLTNDEVKEQLKLLNERLNIYIKAFTSEHTTGPARIDAFGGLFNIITADFYETPQNLLPVIAPASIPFLWFLHRQSYTQWGGQTENMTDAQHLGRNIGEAIGVFARVDVDKSGKGFPSTVRLKNLIALEGWLKDLQSPQWPEDILGKIDREASARGELVFKEHCAGCHSVVDKNTSEIIQIKQHPLSVMGTDPQWNIQTVRSALSGIMQGQKSLGNVGPPLDSVTTAVALANNIVANVSLYNGLQPSGANDTAIIPVNGYKSPILNGVWATGPYLHNGSVPSLKEMLKAPEDRVKTFYVGTYEYDPVNVGFVTDQSDKNRYLFDTGLQGNSNGGHGFAAKLTEQQRTDLLEYLKTL